MSIERERELTKWHIFCSILFHRDETAELKDLVRCEAHEWIVLFSLSVDRFEDVQEQTKHPWHVTTDLVVVLRDKISFLLLARSHFVIRIYPPRWVKRRQQILEIHQWRLIDAANENSIRRLLSSRTELSIDCKCRQTGHRTYKLRWCARLRNRSSACFLRHSLRSAASGYVKVNRERENLFRSVLVLGIDRWKRPVPVAKWAPKVINATQPAPACPQPHCSLPPIMCPQIVRVRVVLLTCDLFSHV